MIVNGGSYRCAGWWAKHLQAPENERARVVKSYGLCSENILDMLHEMEALARGTRCENYFFQINMNPRANERFDEARWDRMREIAEKHHGLEGQAHFVVEHEKNGRVHHHIVWSRIDLEHMRAISDSYGARRNHAIAREIELEFGLEKVTGPYDREPGEPRPKRAPEPWEMYRGMKTGLDPRDIAAEVTKLFHHSDNGKAFQAALEQHGYMLLKGDRRGFVILDGAGKEHSLARRIDGVTTKELNQFMRDLDREALPGVEQGRSLFQERKVAALEADRATVAREIQWEEELARSAIEKEKAESRFVADEAAGKQNEQRSPFEPPRPQDPPHPQLNRTAPELWFGDVAREVVRDPRPLQPPDDLKGAGAAIWVAYNRSHDANAFARALEEQGILLAAVTKEEADRSRREASFAKEVGRFSPVYKTGELVAVMPNWQLWKVNERTTGDKPAEIEKFLRKLDRAGLQGIEATRQAVQELGDSREIERRAFRDLSSVGLLKRDREAAIGKPQIGREPSAAPLMSAGGSVLEGLAQIAGEAMQMIGDMVGASEITPERILAAAEARQQRAEEMESELARRASEDHALAMRAQQDEQRKREEESKRWREKRELER